MALGGRRQQAGGSSPGLPATLRALRCIGCCHHRAPLAAGAGQATREAITARHSRQALPAHRVNAHLDTHCVSSAAPVLAESRRLAQVWKRTMWSCRQSWVSKYVWNAMQTDARSRGRGELWRSNQSRRSSWRRRGRPSRVRSPANPPARPCLPTAFTSVGWWI